jgi:hypothetical protein
MFSGAKYCLIVAAKQSGRPRYSEPATDVAIIHMKIGL